MSHAILCKLCGKRRAKRACPAVNGDICAICCGEQREVTLSCPLACVFLREAYKHEKAIEVPVDQISNPEVEVSEEFISSREELLLFSISSLLEATLRTPGAVDTDVLKALAASIQTRRTAQSGLLYETRAGNTVADAIQRKLGELLKGFEDAEASLEDSSRTAADDIFKMLVFLHRIGQQNLNGRRKGRMFIGMLRAMAPDIGVDERAPSIIL